MKYILLLTFLFLSIDLFCDVNLNDPGYLEIKENLIKATDAGNDKEAKSLLQYCEQN